MLVIVRDGLHSAFPFTTTLTLPLPSETHSLPSVINDTPVTGNFPSTFFLSYIKLHQRSLKLVKFPFLTLFSKTILKTMKSNL